MRKKHFAMNMWGENMLYSHENNVKIGKNSNDPKNEFMVIVQNIIFFLLQISKCDHIFDV